MENFYEGTLENRDQGKDKRADSVCERSGPRVVRQKQEVEGWMSHHSELQRDTAGLAHRLFQKICKEKTHLLRSLQKEEWRWNLSAPFASTSCLPLWHFMKVQKWRDNWARLSYQPRETEKEAVEGIWEGAQGLCPIYSTPCTTQVLLCPPMLSALLLRCGDLHSPERMKTLLPLHWRCKSSQWQRPLPGG